jgi:chromosome segregation ATPase
LGGTPLLNQLLQEATDRCFELKDHATAAAEAVDGLRQKAVSARETLTEEGEEAQRALEEVVRVVEAAQGRLETASGNAQTNFEALAARAAEARDGVGQLLAQVKTSVTELEAREDDVSARLETAQSGVEQDYQALSQRVHELQAVADARLTEAASSITRFREAVDVARQEFGDAQTRFLQSVDQLEAAAWEETQACVTGVQTTLREAAESLVGMGNQILDAHNQAVVALRKKVAEEAVQKVVESLDPVSQAMAALGEDARTQDQAVADACGRIGVKAEAVVQALRSALMPVLAQSGRLK